MVSAQRKALERLWKDRCTVYEREKVKDPTTKLTDFEEMMKQYKDTGEDVYFDIQVTNEDPTSSVGRQTVILKDCNIDGGILAKFDADAEYLDEDMDFTFEDFEMPETFTMLAGME